MAAMSGVWALLILSGSIFVSSASQEEMLTRKRSVFLRRMKNMLIVPALIFCRSAVFAAEITVAPSTAVATAAVVRFSDGTWMEALKITENGAMLDLETRHGKLSVRQSEITNLEELGFERKTPAIMPKADVQAITPSDRTSYYAPDFSKNVFRVFEAYQSVAIQLANDNEGTPVKFYQPDVIKFGVSVPIYRDLSIGYGKAVQTSDKSAKGEPKATDIFFRFTHHALSLDLYLSNQQGYYLFNPDEVKTARPANGYPLYPDMKTSLVALNVVWAFSPERFSLKAAFDQTERQKKSAGTLLLLGALNYGEVSNPSQIVPTDIQSSYPKLIGLQGWKEASASMGLGYAYNWVSAKNLYLMLMMGLRGGVQYRDFQKSTGNQYNLAVGSGYEGRIGFGYLGDSWVCGAKLNVNSFRGNSTPSLPKTSMNVADIGGFLGIRF